MTNEPAIGPAGGPRRPGARALLLLALVGLLTALVRWRLLDVPLERDEGGFAMMARLILDGVPPYAGAFDYKPPGLYLAYALFISLFGGGAAGVHLGLLVTSLGTMGFTYALVSRWSGTTGGLVASVLSQAFLVSSSLLGFAAHATHFVVFWALAGSLLLERGLGARSPLQLLAAGAAFGVATLMKQPGAIFFAAALARPFVGPRPPGDGLRPPAASALLAAGFAVPLLAAGAWLASAGALDDFFYWNVTYPSLVAAGSGTTGLLPRLWRNAVQASGPFLPAWAACAAAFAWLMTRRARFPMRGPFALFFAASAASVAVGYETRTHYFVLLVPALAASAGVAASLLAARIRRGLPRAAVIALPLVAAAGGAAAQRDYLFSTPPEMISRALYHPNQFADAVTVAGWIRARTAPTDRIAVLGSEPEIPYLAERRPASKYLFTNFFNERHGMKDRMEREMIAEIEAAAPAVIVLANQGFSWGAQPRGDWPILAWAAGYLRANYELAGTATPLSPTASRVLWEEDARREPDALAAPLVIFRRIRSGEAPRPLP